VIYVAYTIHVVTCIFLILVVLLQQGKGADLSVFGGGTTQAAFGARGAATLLHKLTVGFFILFMITTISIGVLQRGRQASSVMTGVQTKKETPATTVPPAAPAAAPEGDAAQGSSAPAPPSAPAETQPTAPDASAPAAPAPESSAAATQPQGGSTTPQ
jgi:preprotein translocase subunit SecG